MWRGPYSVSNNPRVLSVIIAELNPIDIQLDLLDFTQVIRHFRIARPVLYFVCPRPLEFLKGIFWAILGTNVINYTQ